MRTRTKALAAVAAGLATVSILGIAAASTTTAGAGTSTLPTDKQRVLDDMAQVAASGTPAAKKSIAQVQAGAAQEGVNEANARKSSAARKSTSSTVTTAASTVNTTTGGGTPGIFTSVEGPFPRAEFSVLNGWQGPGAGPNASEWLTVYAGGVETDTATLGNIPIGGVRIFAGSSANDPATALLADLTATGTTGPVRVTGYSATTVILTDTSGTSVTLHLDTLTMT